MLSLSCNTCIDLGRTPKAHNSCTFSLSLSLSLLTSKHEWQLKVAICIISHGHIPACPFVFAPVCVIQSYSSCSFSYYISCLTIHWSTEKLSKHWVDLQRLRPSTWQPPPVEFLAAPTTPARSWRCFRLVQNGWTGMFWGEASWQDENQWHDFSTYHICFYHFAKINLLVSDSYCLCLCACKLM